MIRPAGRRHSRRSRRPGGPGGGSPRRRGRQVQPVDPSQVSMLWLPISERVRSGIGVRDSMKPRVPALQAGRFKLRGATPHRSNGLRTERDCQAPSASTMLNTCRQPSYQMRSLGQAGSRQRVGRGTRRRWGPISVQQVSTSVKGRPILDTASRWPTRTASDPNGARRPQSAPPLPLTHEQVESPPAATLVPLPRATRARSIAARRRRGTGRTLAPRGQESGQLT